MAVKRDTRWSLLSEGHGHRQLHFSDFLASLIILINVFASAA